MLAPAQRSVDAECGGAFENAGGDQVVRDRLRMHECTLALVLCAEPEKELDQRVRGCGTFPRTSPKTETRAQMLTG